MDNQQRESAVSTKMQILKSLVLIPAVLLMGCEGQNVFRRESNPTKAHQAAIDKSQTWKPGMGPRPAPVDFDNRQFYCAQSFAIAIPGSSTKRAEFREGVSGAVPLTVTAKANVEFSVKIENAPKGMTLKSTKGNTEYQLLWTPGRGDARANIVKIVVNAPELQKACPYGLGEMINVVVDPAPGAPVLSIPDLVATIDYRPLVDFTVEITDVAATAAKPPVIYETGADESILNNPESRTKNVSAKDAIFCQDGVMKNTNDPTQWTYKCSFKPELLKDVATFIKTPQTINAVFFVKAKSTATGLLSSQTSKSIQVVFPVIEKKEEPKAEPASDASATPVQPASAKARAATLPDAKDKKKARVRKVQGARK